MKRSLYYLLPDAGHASQLCKDLSKTAIPQQDIHVVAEDGVDIKGVNDIHRASERDSGFIMEWLLWRIDLAVFGIAFVFLVLAVFLAPLSWLILPLIVMAITFAVGLVFVLRLPNVHLDEFIDAIKHGEVLVVVDVPTRQVAEVGHRIHRQHPEVITGGVCWHV